MAIVLIDAGMRRNFPELVEITIRKIKPYKAESINSDIDRHYFHSKKFAANEIVLAKVIKKDRINIKLNF